MKLFIKEDFGDKQYSIDNILAWLQDAGSKGARKITDFFGKGIILADDTESFLQTQPAETLAEFEREVGIDFDSVFGRLDRDGYLESKQIKENRDGRRIKADSFDDMINQIENLWGYDCFPWYPDVRDEIPKDGFITIYDSEGNEYEAEFSKYSDGRYEIFAHNINRTGNNINDDYFESVSRKKMTESNLVDGEYIRETKQSRDMEHDLRVIYVDDDMEELREEMELEGFEFYNEGNCINPKDCKYIEWVNGTFKVTAYYGSGDNIVYGIYVKSV